MSLAWVPKAAAAASPAAPCMGVPLYLSADRGRVLAEVEVPLAGRQGEAERWRLAAVALLAG